MCTLDRRNKAYLKAETDGLSADVLAGSERADTPATRESRTRSFIADCVVDRGEAEDGVRSQNSWAEEMCTVLYCGLFRERVMK